MGDEDYYNQLWADEPTRLNRHERDRFHAVLGIAANLKRPNDAILEVGCGIGKLSSRLSTLGNVVGVDSSQGAIERASGLFPGVRFECRDWLRDKEEAWRGRFGLTVCSEVIEHVSTARQGDFITRLAGTLRNGGHLILTTPNGERAARVRDEFGGLDQPEENYLSRGELVRFLNGVGLHVRSVQSVTFFETLWERSSSFRRARTLLRPSVDKPELAPVWWTCWLRNSVRFQESVFVFDGTDVPEG